MSAVCPKCGVAVVAGYAKCPKCQSPLATRGTRAATVAGGTAVEARSLPIFPIAGGAGALLLIIIGVKVCGGGSEEPARQPTATPPTGGDTTVPEPRSPTGPVPTPTAPTQPAPDPAAASAELDRALRLKRFWSTIDLRGTLVDVRSGSCDDPAMPSVIDSVAVTLRGAGLTRLRCLAQSGTVVFERNL